MNKKNGPSLGHNKKSLLKSEVEHIDITSFDSRKIIESMKKMSFTSRDTANASKIFNEIMKNCIDKSKNYDWKKTSIEIEKAYQILKKN